LRPSSVWTHWRSLKKESEREKKGKKKMEKIVNKKGIKDRERKWRKMGWENSRRRQ